MAGVMVCGVVRLHAPHKNKEGMQYYNNILAIEARWLLENKVFSVRTYKNLAYRKDINVVRRGCRGCEALVAYESLPDRFKAKVDELLGGNAYKMAETNILAELLEDNREAAAYFDEFTISDGRHLPLQRRREYYANAVVLDAIGREIERRKGRRKSSGVTGKNFWGELKDAAANIDRTRYPHNLPENERSLERKFKEYKSEGYECLIHRNYIEQHRNAAKVMDEGQMNVLATLVSDPRNLDDVQVSRLYNMMAETMKWKTITSSTVAIWRNKLDSDIYARRHGAKAWANDRTMQVKRKAPEFPLYYWTMDGWDVELAYQDKKDGKATTYTNRITMVVVLDACCKYPIGYAIGLHESPALIREALRNAHKHTEQLFGQMYRVQQIQSDRYQMKNLTPLYEVSGDKVTPAAVGNAKAKIIEPWFKYFNKKYCQLQPNWTGFGVTSRRELQPNGDFLQKHKTQFPDFAGVCAQVVRFLEAERAELHDAYVGKFTAMPAENRLPLPLAQYLLAYGETSGRTNVLQGSGLKIIIGGIRRDYDCFDLTFRDHPAERWHVVYDPDDLHVALAVNKEQTLQYELEEKYVQPMALIERTEGDYAELERVRAYNERMKEKMKNKMVGYQEGAAKALDGQKMLEMTQKFLITDSRGQHKDRRNEARDIVVQEVETIRTETEEMFSALDEY